MKRGFFIVFEGGEGTGKSTQAEILANRLRKEGYSIVMTREPGGTKIGEQIRAITHNQENADLDPRAEAYLMAASRAQHVAEIIGPALAQSKIVICDRFVDSSIVYQGYGRKLGAEIIERLNELAVNGAVADLVILLDIPPEIGLERRSKSLKARDRLDLQPKDFYERVSSGYLTLAQKHPGRYVIIDTARSIEQVAADVWQAVKGVLD